MAGGHDHDRGDNLARDTLTTVCTRQYRYGPGRDFDHRSGCVGNVHGIHDRPVQGCVPARAQYGGCRGGDAGACRQRSIRRGADHFPRLCHGIAPPHLHHCDERDHRACHLHDSLGRGRPCDFCHLDAAKDVEEGVLSLDRLSVAASSPVCQHTDRIQPSSPSSQP